MLRFGTILAPPTVLTCAVLGAAASAGTARAAATRMATAPMAGRADL